MTIAAQPHQRPPHPVAFDVEYPERLSRWLIFVKLLLAIPHFIIVYLLYVPLYILTVLAWFAILFTGRYPKSMHEFCVGVLRWQANLMAYVGLLRDEYPPFSFEPGDYPLDLHIPRAERQSRFRLFIRFFAIIPNYIVLYFVQIAWFFTTIISWFAILFTGSYPRGLFKFAAGVLRWQQRQLAYITLLRDEYPPYSINANARPGNEVLSAILGLPLLAAYVLLSLLPFAGLLRSGQDIVPVEASLLDSPAALSRERPSGEANNLRLTLIGYDEAASTGALDEPLEPGYHLISFRVVSEKDGFWPTFYTPFLFFLDDCFSEDLYAVEPDAINSDNFFKMYWRGGRDVTDVYFQLPFGAEPCELRYFAGAGQIRFQFE